MRRTSSSRALSTWCLAWMPVGARYSPNTSRRTWPHSPVVTPALAASIEGGMMFRPSAAAALRSTSACRTAFVVALLPPGLERGDLADLDRFRHGLDAFDAARRERRLLGLGIGVDADQHLLALLDRLDPGGVRRDQRLFHVVDGRHRPAYWLGAWRVRRGPGPSAPRPCGRSRPSRRRCRRIRAGRSRRRRSAGA